MEGAAAVTQCALPPGMTMTYNFTVSISGIGRVHSHSGLQIMILEIKADPGNSVEIQGRTGTIRTLVAHISMVSVAL
jgi:hypothetical protein